MENLAMNNFYSFKNYVKEKIKEKLGDEYRVNLHDVSKNNGIFLTGINIAHKDCNISPTIYLNNYYDAYCDGKITKDAIIKDIIYNYEKNKIDKTVDISFLTDYEAIKDRIVYKLINAENNSELLKNIPYIPYLDLAIVFELLISEESFGNATILIHNEHCKIWKVDTEELYKQATYNTPKLLKYEVKNMKDLICEMLFDSESKEFIESEDIQYSMPMYVLSNKRKINGSGVILYPELLCDFAKAIKSDILVIPSSIHESILIPVDSIDTIDNIREMIKEINDTQLCTEEILSYNPYYFDRSTGLLRIA